MSDLWNKTGTLAGCTEYVLEIPFFYRGKFHCFLHECSKENNNMVYMLSAKFPGCEYRDYILNASSLDVAKSEVTRLLSRCCDDFVENRKTEIEECEELKKLLK